MPLVYGRELPDYSIKVLESEIDVVDTKMLLFIASRNASLFPGLRIVKSTEGFIRKRFKNIIGAGGELTAAQIILFREVTLAQRLLCVFSKDALSMHLEDLAVFFGVDDFITGLYFDSREEVRELVDSLEGKYKKLKEKSPKKAREHLEDMFSEFLTLIHPLCSCNAAFEIGEKQLKDVQEKLKKSEKKVISLKDELEKSRVNNSAVKKAEKKILKLEGINRDQEEKIAELKKRISKQKEEYKQQTDVLYALKAEHDELLASFEITIDNKVQAELDDLKNKWLKSAIEMDDVVHQISKSSDNILEEAEKVLAAQADRDKHYGNIRHLTDMRNKLVKTRSELIKAHRDSINPLPALNQLIERISSEIGKIDNSLGKKVQLSDFSLKCIDKISSAVDIEELVGIYTMLGNVRKAEVLSYSELVEIEKAYMSKVNALMETFPDNTELVFEHPFMEFIHYLKDSNSDVLLLLDGHNILHRMHHIFDEFYEDGIPGKDAREALIRKMNILNENHPNTRVNLYFDGPQASHQNISELLKVIYSGGNYDEHRADRVIMDYLEFLDKEGITERLAVVSDDTEIANFASQKGALPLSVNDLAQIISAY